MIYISAQPDDYYFLWQLELQLHNFNKLGISAENIHVLIGYSPKRGLRHYLQDFVDNNKANYFTYPDERKQKAYLSSLRPHLIKQHIKAFPELENSAIFYHDSDIVFREIPDFASMIADNSWYASDTQSYLNANYIKKQGSEELLLQMCKVVGILPDIVLRNNTQVGGAQYLLKSVSCDFWDKVEHDCEALYELIQKFNNQRAELAYLKSRQKKSDYKGIQAWYADMWAILWNAWKFGYEVKIHKELDFCWPHEPIKEWKGKKILHYSGIIAKEDHNVFRKADYVHYPPYYNNNLNQIPIDNCSYPLVQLIENYEKETLSAGKIDLRDLTFLIPVAIDSDDKLETLQLITRYLYKHFHTQILIIETNTIRHLKDIQFPPNCKVYFHPGKINHHLINLAKTNLVAIYNIDVILSPQQIVNSTEKLRNNEATLVTIPEEGTVINVDRLFKAIFDKILDFDLLLLNQNKFTTTIKGSFGTVIFLNRNRVIAGITKDRHINSSCLEDTVRSKQISILDYRTAYINGLLFYLPIEERKSSTDVSIKHSNMNKGENAFNLTCYH